MERVTTIAEVRDHLAVLRARGATVGLVPTMGALHEGHLSLVRLAADRADTVVVSIFVNPTQFDRADDLAAYPRDLAADEEALAALGRAAPDLVFAPFVTEMYPRPPATTITASGLADHLCGATRPGHFDGVGLVVTKLLHIAAPDVAVFGRKDRQQLQIIRRLVEDLDLPVEIVAGPTVREHDGIALSSRNVRLTPADRPRARALSQGLRAAVLTARDARAAGRPVAAGELRSAAAAVLEGAGVALDYLDVVDPETMQPTTRTTGDAGPLVVAVAAEVGPVRLIDNVEVGAEGDEERLLGATG
jgi:pantoate--beta-alanine ligase